LKRLKEDTHVAVRNIRRDSLEQLRAMEKDKGISQDELHRYQEQLQKLTDLSVVNADQVGSAKETELMEV
jgi:ribosome recycling factor